MSERYSLVSFIFATSIPTFLEELFYTAVLIGMFVGMLWFMERHKMFESEPKRRRFRRR